ncbi:Holliday junction resolvase RuvX [Pukyongia salina]|uniref:Putative pre-16S rRNA nuclease n=1 Tax=Pukyongia salina TaxID=2094025 RepID=A0A2S0HSW5_9FLAO|nr:Holliday junction resolvase RuvX [Pukyongia salina]AVI49789.1 Holliday junction resolvase RuvX [Pukyongia salina]
MGRILALDYGTKRTGIAVTDELRIIASGLTTVSTEELMSFLENYFEKEIVDLILVGEPKQKDGTHSDVEENIKEFLTAFTNKFPTMEVQRVDERYSSKQAFQSMIDGGLKKKKRRDKALLDEISATIILQEYLYKQ